MAGRQVAEFPPERQPINKRMPANPIDKTTIVSIYPREIIEEKITIDPWKFKIPAGTVDKPGILVVGTSSYWAKQSNDMPAIEVPISSVKIAESIIEDYSKGMAECDMVDARPGLFFVPGTLTAFEIKAQYKEALEAADIKQKNWFMRLVKVADALWSRSGQNPLALSNDMRIAAEGLNLKDKPWLRDYQTAELVPCFACGSLKNPLFPVCATCRAIDPKHEMSKEIKFAGV